jgi:ubiquinone/menaquinone biosynthesis C-methylase UbiE
MHSIAFQKQAFQKYEANQWFARNKSLLNTFKGESDIVSSLITQYRINPIRILEIGSSAGYRLNYLKSLFPSALVVGIDPSTDAIQEGMKLYPNIELHVATADDLSMFDDGFFDLVIIGFVLYVIDRSLLLKVVGEIDRVLTDKGLLINTDFFSEKAIQNKYQHISDFEAFSFKQRYENIFLASEMYHLIHMVSFNHSDLLPDATDDYFNKCSTTILKKDVSAAYK